MASRSLDGCRVIRAAEQRLAFAKKCEKIAQGQVELLEAAKTQLTVAQNEVKEATSFLEETCDKLHVIDVDEDDDMESGGRKRKRKVSLCGNGKKARTDANLPAASQPSVAPASDTTTGNENVIEQIVIHITPHLNLLFLHIL